MTWYLVKHRDNFTFLLPYLQLVMIYLLTCYSAYTHSHWYISCQWQWPLCLWNSCDG